MTPAPRTGACPSCGAPVDFLIGSSRAAVCGYCRAVVSRAGQRFEAIGRAADVIPTGSRIGLSSKGRLDGAAFLVVGRLQYEWQSGVWDEWYVAFQDGRWGWLAEAQGRFYMTFLVPPRPLPTRGIVPGASFFFEGLGRFVVSDVKRARIAGISGELPDPVRLGDTPFTADLSTEGGGFATLDLGTGGETPALFVGREVPFAALHLGELPDAARLDRARPEGASLQCPSCGAPVTVRIPERSVRVVCASCNHLLDTTQGALRVIEAIHRSQHEPRVPLGTKGTLRGHDVVVAGWMLRSCVVEGTRYPWDEYLLWEQKSQSFLWLVDSEGHWQLGQAISVAEVHVGSDALYRGRRFRRFSGGVRGVVERVLGEMYWEVRTGDAAYIDEFVAPPEGLSCERTEDEVNWTHLVHLERAEVAQAFGQPRLANAPQQGVGTLQPWPHEASLRRMGVWMIGSVGALFVLLFLFALRADVVYLDKTFTAAELADTEAVGPAGEKAHGYLSDPFQVPDNEALEVELTTDVNQSWAVASCAIIHDASGESVPFDIETSYYSGVEDGESWSEGSQSGSETLSAPGAGATYLRADLTWDPALRAAPSMRLRVTRDGFSGFHFFVVLLFLLSPLLLFIGRASFEKKRWYNSNLHPPSSSSSSDDED